MLSLAGNAVYHLIDAELLQVAWVIVLGVGAIPPVVLGLVSHLAVLRTQNDHFVEVELSTVLGPVLPSESGPVELSVVRELPIKPVRTQRSAQKKVAIPRYASDDELLRAAHAADASYRQAHGDKPITRDELRRALRIGGERATLLLRQLRAKPIEAA